MTECVLGMPADDAQGRLAAAGYDVQRVVYVSRRGVENADSLRVVRQRAVGDNRIEITVSHFKTRVG